MREARRTDGYLPIADYGLIGDGATGALIGLDGSIDWLCVPRFDDPPLFCGILDADQGGRFAVGLARAGRARQRYEADTGVLVTESEGPDGRISITDALALRPGVDLTEDSPAAIQSLVRRVRALRGPVEVQVEISPKGAVDARRGNGDIELRLSERPDLPIHLRSSRALEGLRTTIPLEEGEEFELVLDWSGRPPSEGDLIETTLSGWRRWVRHFSYDGPQEDLVRRSAITLKLLDHFENGAIVAAPTSSLPEAIGGHRNWDYRYSWIRDAAFSVYALRRIGLEREAAGFLRWVLDAVERSGRPRVLYDLDGRLPPAERVDPDLKGYRGSWPVRWGNAAVQQVQQDVYGEILDCAYQWMAVGGEIDEPLWDQLRALAEAAGRQWNDPDHGIWEVRTHPRPFTYSAALCQVALDRAVRIAQRLGLPGEVRRWSHLAGRISGAILEQAWNDEKGTLTSILGGTQVDGSLLALPMRRLLPAHDPRMVSTVETIRSRLDAGDGLLYRYLPEDLPDGLPPGEGAFVLCSFWLVDNLAHQGRIDEAGQLYETLCGRVNHLGLLSEEIDPSDGSFLGNFPQAFSHVGLISSGYELSRLSQNRPFTTVFR